MYFLMICNVYALRLYRSGVFKPLIGHSNIYFLIGSYKSCNPSLTQPQPPVVNGNKLQALQAFFIYFYSS